MFSNDQTLVTSGCLGYLILFIMYRTCQCFKLKQTINVTRGSYGAFLGECYEGQGAEGTRRGVIVFFSFFFTNKWPVL